MYKKEEVSHFEVTKELNRNSILFTVKEDRGIGKTVYMTRYAKENNLPLIVRDNAIKNMLKKSEVYEDVEVYSATENIRGIRPKNAERGVFLVDDITEEQYETLQKTLGFKLVGFVSVES